ncbi:MAG: sugar transferase [Oscillospiraceae bacterium]|jgi:O-antigen biosynthesis protein WbqP|nr:sugar transferase [Oscillospiraceae bacterium]
MKRAFDVILSLCSLLALSPLFCMIALVILLDDGRPVIFRQERVGRGNALFRIRKFRTMRKDTRSAAFREIKDEDCYTRSGRVLRRLSLDELPQLINILEGTMSFVGPRPLIPEEGEIRRRRAEEGIYDLPPGLTGWAQVNGRATLSDDKKLRLDAEYRRKHSFLFDLKILLWTALQVLARKDVE